MVDEDIPRLSVVCPGDVTEEDIRPFFFFFFLPKATNEII